MVSNKLFPLYMCMQGKHTFNGIDDLWIQLLVLKLALR